MQARTDLGKRGFAWGGAWDAGPYGFLISIASIRLRQAGLDIPEQYIHKEPELELYNYLQRDRSGPYAYYNALLNTLNSFCLALEMKARS